MKITNKFDIHLDDYQPQAEIRIMQCDANTRVLEFTLYANKQAWQIPAEAKLYVSYCKPDGTGGFYDTLPDGTVACYVEGDNTIIAILAEQVLTVPGKVPVSISIQLDDKILATFAVQVCVMPNPGVGAMESKDYFSLKAAIDAAERAAEQPSIQFTVLKNEDGTHSVVEGYTIKDLIAAHEAGLVLQCYWYDEYILARLTDYQSGSSGPFVFSAVSQGNEYRVIISDSGVKCSVKELSKDIQKLTFTGAVEAEYDGSEPLSVEIPKGALWVTVSRNSDGTYVANESFQAIRAAHVSGRMILCHYGEYELLLTNPAAKSFGFSCINQDGDYLQVFIEYTGLVTVSTTQLEGTVKTVNGIAPDKNGNVTVAGEGGGNLTVTDDGNGNITITATGDVTITDDGEGNIMIGYGGTGR